MDHSLCADALSDFVEDLPPGFIDTIFSYLPSIPLMILLFVPLPAFLELQP